MAKQLGWKYHDVAAPILRPGLRPGAIMLQVLSPTNIVTIPLTVDEALRLAERATYAARQTIKLEASGGGDSDGD